ncbi:hypothetical protein FRC96_14000 [Lujinxingia vulgaris]|uniref:Uncharacterized protein n=1 Tax=Lujinxingia vulgaris TaxID=2600176 RepID=A0A5C6WZV0_9DELT|nr:hypothetical protein FRC96_14000 [Lujinxingia vulgaris]
MFHGCFSVEVARFGGWEVGTVRGDPGLGEGNPGLGEGNRGLGGNDRGLGEGDPRLGRGEWVQMGALLGVNATREPSESRCFASNVGRWIHQGLHGTGR